VQTLPPRKWLVVISSLGMLLTHKTFKLLFFFFLSLAVLLPQEKKKVCLTIQSVIDPQHTVNPTINILSAHAHHRGSGASQKVRYQWRVQGHPNTMHHWCNAISYKTFL
jgi:hypothetical protein